MGTGRKDSILAIFWFPRKEIRPIQHLCLLTMCMFFWMLTQELVQSDDWLTTVALKDTFSTLVFQWLPDRGENGHLYLV